MPKVSIIIPVYGVEKYIEKCARSLFEQTLEDIEFIFIDDCTPDASIKVVKNVLDSYPNRKKQVVFHKMETNSGQAKVREWGITHATGEYIANCDSDDWPEQNMYEMMYASAVKGKSDVVICNYYRLIESRRIVKKAFVNGLSHEEVIRDLCSQRIPYCLWNKIIRRDLFDSKFLTFPAKPHGEDMALCLQIFSREEIKISYVDEPFYNYRSDSNTLYHMINEASVMRKFESAVENVNIIVKHYKKIGILKKYESSIMYLKMTSRDKLISLINQKKYYNIWNNTFPEINRNILFNKEIKFKHKLKYILAKYRIFHFDE